MNPDDQAEIPAVPATEPEVPPQEPSQEEKNPVEAELDRVERKPKRSKLDTLKYTRERVDKQISEEEAKLGINTDEDRPLTVREFNELNDQKAIDTALSLADDIADESERKLTKHHLENTIRPSGDPQADLRTARLLVNAVKTEQVVEEIGRAKPAKAHGSAPSAPPRVQKDDELTKDERDIMQWTGISKDKVLKARAK